MESQDWEAIYASVKMPRTDPAVTAFNAGIDRVIPVTAGLLRCLERLPVKEGGTVLAGLKHAMRYCSAGEVFIRDVPGFKAVSAPFADTGTRTIGGQAGIAAVHLRRLGVPSVMVAVPQTGPRTSRMLRKAGVIPVTFGPAGDDDADLPHLVFEFSPGLVPLAPGVVPRNNRFIVSPLHGASSVLIPGTSLGPFLERIALCRRAFLSGYQYLRTGQEFRAAAAQVREIRGVHPGMRTHAECVSAASRRVMALMLRHIIPSVDSIGLNEVELALFTRALQLPGQRERGTRFTSPVECVRDALALAEATGVSRVQVHTFGWYLIVLAGNTRAPDASRDSLLLAAQATAAAAGGDGQALLPEGLRAYEEVRAALGPEEGPGIFRQAGHVVIVVPTIISRNIRKTAGLGDMLSSTAFVTDPF